MFTFENRKNTILKEDNIMKMTRHILTLLMTLFLIWQWNGLPAFSQADQMNCYSVLAGKKATVNGAVLFAHNEDDGGRQIVRWFRVPARDHRSREKIRLQNGGKVPEAAHTVAYLWLEMPGMKFSDGFLNEYGVVIASDACASREDRPELTDGGIGWNLRRLMAERAHSAREAVKIGGALVSAYGYASSGRTYCIAGPREAWMLSVVNGKHWVARRIPDDQVAIIPNYYTITQVDMKDTVNFYGSPDLIGYAKERGWYNPAKEGAFNFRKAYGKPANQANRRNITREWGGLRYLAGKPYALEDVFPFSFVPKKKLTLEDLMQVLRDHYEGTPLDLTEGYKKGSPHYTKERTICTATTRYGFVAELRGWMPPAVGAVMWLAPRRPCTQAFTPWYAGITRVPEDYDGGDYEKALKNHLQHDETLYMPEKAPAYYSFAGFSEYADSNYLQVISKVKPANRKFEQDIMKNQGNFERMILPLFNGDRNKALEMITKYTGQLAEENLRRNKATEKNKNK